MKSILLAALASACAAQTPKVQFLVPDDAESRPPILRRMTDPAGIARYESWMNNDSARWALALYGQAFELARKQGRQPDQLHIMLVPGGNHADIGFRIKDDPADYSRAAYIRLDAQPFRFITTVLHETGHVAMSMLAGGAEFRGTRTSAIPHSTASLTDRATAFQEGWAIHLETVAAQRFNDPELRMRYRHERIRPGSPASSESEYHRQLSDLLSYSQSRSRYDDVRENSFAFESAFQPLARREGAYAGRPSSTSPVNVESPSTADANDYVRIQLDKARDFATLRDANQLLQSEGFHASFFYTWVMRGDGLPSDAVVRQRYRRIFMAFEEMFKTHEAEPDSPWLLRFVETYRRLFPDEAAELIDTFMDLSHGVFIDRGATELWRKQYLAALRLDFKGLDPKTVQEKRKAWSKSALESLEVLYSLLGPQVPARVKAVTVTLPFGSSPLCFDVNTAQAGVARLVPGIREEEVGRWIAARPFKSAEDFRNRSGLRSEVLAAIEF